MLQGEDRHFEIDYIQVAWDVGKRIKNKAKKG